jgi:hypothetical protein
MAAADSVGEGDCSAVPVSEFQSARLREGRSRKLMAWALVSPSHAPLFGVPANGDCDLPKGSPRQRPRIPLDRFGAPPPIRDLSSLSVMDKESLG